MYELHFASYFFSHMKSSGGLSNQCIFIATMCHEICANVMRNDLSLVKDTRDAERKDKVNALTKEFFLECQCVTFTCKGGKITA